MYQPVIMCRGGIGRGSKICDVGNSLLLVHNQILDEEQILRGFLRHQPCWRVSIRPAIVHVHVQIPAQPLGIWLLGNLNRLEMHHQLRLRACHNSFSGNLIFEAFHNLDVDASERDG